LGFGLLNAAMLLGLVGTAVPVVIHLLNRRRDQVVDWGAMQFLELGRTARRKLQLTEFLLMLSRMALLALVALALARPFWGRSSRAEAAGAIGAGGSSRDVVLVFDGSASMERKAGGTSPRLEAVQWARRFIRELRPGDSAAVLLAGDRVQGLVDPPSFDMAKVEHALATLERSHGSSDLPSALAEAFRVLERTGNPERDIIILTDGQRLAWRPGESKRWDLLRDLQRRLPIPPHLWALAFGAGTPSDGPNGAVGPLSVSRSLVTPGLPITITTTLSNAGPGPLSRTAELLVDDRPEPGSAQVVGPIPAGGKTPLRFRTSLPNSGPHLLAVRLTGGDDALPGDDEAAIPIDVSGALPVLLVDGEPGLQPLSGETDFLRAALSPTGDETPQVRATVLPLDALTPDSLKDQRVLVLANVARLSAPQSAAINAFVDAGGGLLIAPGDRTDADAFSRQDGIPAGLGDLKGEAAQHKTLAHPDPRSFNSPALGPFASGDAPALSEADFFAYRLLAPMPGASVSARLDPGDPWIVERPQGKGRIMLLATALDAEAGTLPANPDFVPLVHEWIFHLAGTTEAQRVRPGEPLVFELNPPPAPEFQTLLLQTPKGTKLQAPILRASGSAQVRLDVANASGIYRLTLPDPPGGFAYAAVEEDGRESDLAPLEPAESLKLAEGWPLSFETDPRRLGTRLVSARAGGRHEVWRALILAALVGLCLEVYLTRRLVRSQGLDRT